MVRKKQKPRRVPQGKRTWGGPKPKGFALRGYRKPDVLYDSKARRKGMKYEITVCPRTPPQGIGPRARRRMLQREMLRTK